MPQKPEPPPAPKPDPRWAAEAERARVQTRNTAISLALFVAALASFVAWGAGQPVPAQHRRCECAQP